MAYVIVQAAPDDPRFMVWSHISGNWVYVFESRKELKRWLNTPVRGEVWRTKQEIKVILDRVHRTGTSSESRRGAWAMTDRGLAWENRGTLWREKIPAMIDLILETEGAPTKTQVDLLIDQYSEVTDD